MNDRLNRPRLIPDCDQAETGRLLDELCERGNCDCQASDAWRCAVIRGLVGQVVCHCECHRSGPPRPRATIAELQTAIDRRDAEDQRRILKRHAAAAREWPGGEPVSEEDPSFGGALLKACAWIVGVALFGVCIWIATAFWQ